MPAQPNVLSRIPAQFASVGVFLVGALALVLPGGYNIGPALLLLLGLGYLLVPPYPRLNRQDWLLIAALLIYAGAGCLSNTYHHLSHSSYDNFSRFLLAVPVLLLLRRMIITPAALWLGLALGALGGGIVALWNFFGQGAERAEGFNNAIQFGDIAMLFSALLLAGLGWARTRTRAIQLLLIGGILAGLLASFLSGARGGWLALPLILALPYGYYGLHRVPVYNRALVLVVAVLLAAALFHKGGLLSARMVVAVQDVQAYQQQHNVTSSIGARLHMWTTARQMIAERPLMGWGSLEKYSDPAGQPEPLFSVYNHVHNDMLDALAKRGILGGLALMVLYCLPALLFYRRLGVGNAASQAAALAGLLLVLSTLVFGFTQTFFAHTSGVMVYTFLMVILWSQSGDADGVRR